MGLAVVPALSEAVIFAHNLNRDLERMVADVAARPHIRGILLPFAEHASLAIVDIDEAGGMEAAREIRNQDRSVPILIVAADMNSALDLASIGRVDFLQKPVIPELLSAKLQILIRPESRNRVEVASITTDAEGRILEVNQKAEELFGSIPENLMRLIPGWQPLNRDGEQMIRNRMGLEVPARIISKSMEEDGQVGYRTYVLESADRHHQGTGSFDQCLEELQEKKGKLKQFARAIGHDFREPLRMVVSYTQLVEHRFGSQLGDEAQPLMQFVVEGAKRIDELLQALAHCMELESADYDCETVDCEDALEEALEKLKANIEASKAVITRSPMPKVKGDASRLIEVFSQLLENALKFNSSPVPVLRVWAEQRNGHWMVSIQDNGIGIESDQMERAFTIFKRLNGSRYPGSGIGLTVCTTIVKRHGGRIWAESTPGEGSIFRFTLPALQS